MEKLKKIWQYILKKRWHLHCSIAFVGNFLYFYFGNQYSFMRLDKAMWQGIKGTQYYFQFFISAFLTLFVAYCWELYQMRKGANRTDAEWKNEAYPDIKATVIAGVVGYLVEFTFFEIHKFIN